MSMKFNDNIAFVGKYPNFERDMFQTIEDMKNYSLNYLPDVFIATCVEDGNVWIFNRSNEDDPISGRWRKLDADVSLKDEFIAAYSVGGIKEGDHFEANTSFEDIVKKMLVGETTPGISFYYGVNANKITDLSLLTEIEPVSAYTAVVTANNEYVIFAVPLDSNVKIMATGFDYTDSFEKVETSMYRFYYSEYKTTCNNFEYNIIFE